MTTSNVNRVADSYKSLVSVVEILLQNREDFECLAQITKIIGRVPSIRRLVRISHSLVGPEWPIFRINKF